MNYESGIFRVRELREADANSLFNMYSGSSSDVTQSAPSWDGKVNGNEANEGVYTYTFKATGISGSEISGHGFFHLFKN